MGAASTSRRRTSLFVGRRSSCADETGTVVLAAVFFVEPKECIFALCRGEAATQPTNSTLLVILCAAFSSLPFVPLQRLHFYRKTPADLTESTTSGGAISFVALVLMIYLFVSQLFLFFEALLLSTPSSPP